MNAQAAAILSHPDYQRMIAKADAEGVMVAARFAHKDTDKPVAYTVKSGARIHVLKVIDGKFKCSCEAGQNGIYCKHRAAAARYEIERAAKRAAVAEAAALLQEARAASEDRAAWVMPSAPAGPRITR